MGQARLEEEAEWVGWEWGNAGASCAESHNEVVFQWTEQYNLLSYKQHIQIVSGQIICLYQEGRQLSGYLPLDVERPVPVGSAPCAPRVV